MNFGLIENELLKGYHSFKLAQSFTFSIKDNIYPKEV